MHWVILLLLACSGEEDKKDWKKWEKEEPAMLIKFTSVERGEVANHLQVTGTLESITQANIVPEATGTVQRVRVREGDSVKKGQLLAQLINSNIEANYERSKIDLNRAKREHEKAKNLHEQGAISDRELQEAESTLKTSETANNEALAAAKTTAIRSPITGIIATVNIREGEVVNASQVFQVVNLKQLRLVALVPERDLPLLKENQPVQVTAAYDDQATVVGYIERIAPVVDPNTGSVKVFINLQSEQQTLRPGQFVKASIEIDRHTDTVVVDKSAIIYEDGMPIAFVVADAPEEDDPPINEDSPKENKDSETIEDDKERVPYIAERRELKLGYTDTKLAEVQEGLKVGEKVITAGNTAIEDKSPIKMKLPPASKKKSEDETKTPLKEEPK
jgi:membrane fusion protein, multidrug efflux system